MPTPEVSGLVKRQIVAEVYTEQLQEELRSLEAENISLEQRLVREKAEFEASRLSLHRDIQETKRSFEDAASNLETSYVGSQKMQREFRDDLEEQDCILKGQLKRVASATRQWKDAKGPLDCVRGKNENMKDHLDNLRANLMDLLKRLDDMDKSIELEKNRNAIEFADGSNLDSHLADHAAQRTLQENALSETSSTKLPAYQKVKVLGSKKIVAFNSVGGNVRDLTQSNSMPNLGESPMPASVSNVPPPARISRRNAALAQRTSTVPVQVLMAANQGPHEDQDDRGLNAEYSDEEGSFHLIVDGKKLIPSKIISSRKYECEVPSLVILLLRIISKSKNLAKLQNVVNALRSNSDTDADLDASDLDSDSGALPQSPFNGLKKEVLSPLVVKRPIKNINDAFRDKRRWKQREEGTMERSDDQFTINPTSSKTPSPPNVPKVIEDLLSAIECMMLATVEERTASAMNNIQGVQVILDTIDRFESPGVHAQATKLLWKILMHSPSKSKTLLAKNGIHHLSKSLKMYCFVPAVHITTIECLHAILPSDFIEATQRHGGEDIYAELMKQNVSNRRNAVVMDAGFGGGRGAPKELARRGLDLKKKQTSKSFQVLHKEGSEPLVQILKYKTDRMKAGALRKIDRALVQHNISHAEIASLNMGKAIRVVFATLLFCLQQATTTKPRGGKSWAALQEVFVLRSKSIAHLCEALYILMLKDEHSYVDELMSHPKQLGILLRILDDFYTARNVMAALCRLFCVLLSNKKLSREDMVHAGLPAGVKRGVAAHGPDAELHGVSAPILEYFGDKTRRLQRAGCGRRNPPPPSPAVAGLVPATTTGLLPSVV